MRDSHNGRGRRGGGMNFDKFLRSMGPLVAAAAVGGIMAAAKKNGNFDFKWDEGDFNWGKDCGKGFGRGFGPGFATGFGGDGVPLDELDMGGDSPTQLVLAGADQVIVTEGDDFAIAVQGDDDAKDTLRFRLDDDGALHIASGNSSHGGEGIATINITMPAPEKVTIAGAGEVALSSLADDAEVKVAGSGQISVLDLDIEELDVTIAGAGRFTAGGKAERLNISVAGAGKAEMSGLLVDIADVDLAGAGNATFACDGEVNADIVGAGHVTVRGSAKCRVHSMGSGYLVCEPREDKAA